MRSSVCLSGVNDSFNVLMAVRMHKVQCSPGILFETSRSIFILRKRVINENIAVIVVNIIVINHHWSYRSQTLQAEISLRK